jgi:hypothetical protein
LFISIIDMLCPPVEPLHVALGRHATAADPLSATPAAPDDRVLAVIVGPRCERYNPIDGTSRRDGAPQLELRKTVRLGRKPDRCHPRPLGFVAPAAQALG